ncbi:MAG: PH domain-containing protein, partial [Nocardioidaceae bacterium]
LLPGVLLLVVLGLAGYLTGLVSGAHADALRLAIWVVAVLLLLPFTLWPFLGWLTSTYTVTNRRLITRTGILSRRGHDIPLARVNDVAYEHGLMDRMLGCGTLVISDASQHGRVTLPDIPHVERVHLAISELLYSHTDGDREGAELEARRIDDGT